VSIRSYRFFRQSQPAETCRCYLRDIKPAIEKPPEDYWPDLRLLSQLKQEGTVPAPS
jgi:hypothetical protein